MSVRLSRLLETSTFRLALVRRHLGQADAAGQGRVQHVVQHTLQHAWPCRAALVGWQRLGEVLQRARHRGRPAAGVAEVDALEHRVQAFTGGRAAWKAQDVVGLQRGRLETREAVLEIQPQQLLVAAQHPQFGDRRLAGLPDQLARRAQPMQPGFQHRRGLVGAGHGEHPNPTTKRGDVDRHVGRAARTFLHLLDLDHRHGRFRRNPRAGTIPIAIQHHIAGDQHPSLFERGNLRFHRLIWACCAMVA